MPPHHSNSIPTALSRFSDGRATVLLPTATSQSQSVQTSAILSSGEECVEGEGEGYMHESHFLPLLPFSTSASLWNPIFSIWAPAKKNYLVCGRISRNCETTECHSSRKRKPTWKRGMIFVYTPQFCRKILHNTARRWREKSYYSSLFLALDLLS